jgi:hypothetical protein
MRSKSACNSSPRAMASVSPGSSLPKNLPQQSFPPDGEQVADGGGVGDDDHGIPRLRSVFRSACKSSTP